MRRQNVEEKEPAIETKEMDTAPIVTRGENAEPAGAGIRRVAILDSKVEAKR